MNYYHAFLVFFTINTITPLIQGKCGYITRKDWKAESPTDVEKMTAPGSYIAIHHTYIPGLCTTTDECKKAMKSMQNYHKNELQWGDIGYSFCIGGDGNIYEGRGWGIVGAHTLGWNRNSIGVCFIGDFRNEKPSKKMLDCLDVISNEGVTNGGLSKNFKYFGHLQVSSTECPGKAFYEYIKKLPRYTSNPTKNRSYRNHQFVSRIQI